MGRKGSKVFEKYSKLAALCQFRNILRRSIRFHFAKAPHNPEVAGSSPVPATKSPRISFEIRGLSMFSRTFSCALFLLLFSDPYFDPYWNPERLGSESTGEDATHRFRRLPLCRRGHVGVGVQREACTVVPQHPGDRLDVYPILQGYRREC